jgi:hypothetical protein
MPYENQDNSSIAHQENLHEPAPNTDAPAPKNMKSCYCDYLSDEFRRQHNIPEGYCGICQQCGAPGHTRHHPAPVAYTGTWCNRCYRKLQWTWMFRTPVGLFILSLIVLLLLFLLWTKGL